MLNVVSNKLVLEIREEFIEELSDLKIIDTSELLFKSYEAYLKTDSFQEKEEIGFSTSIYSLEEEFTL